MHSDLSKGWLEDRKLKKKFEERQFRNYGERVIGMQQIVRFKVTNKVQRTGLRKHPAKKFLDNKSSLFLRNVVYIFYLSNIIFSAINNLLCYTDTLIR